MKAHPRARSAPFRADVTAAAESDPPRRMRVPGAVAWPDIDRSFLGCYSETSGQRPEMACSAEDTQRIVLSVNHLARYSSPVRAQSVACFRPQDGLPFCLQVRQWHFDSFEVDMALPIWAKRLRNLSPSDGANAASLPAV